MQSTVDLHPEFTLDVLDEAEFLEERSVGLGAEFLDAVDAALSLIARVPLEQAPWLLEGVPTGVRWTKVGKFEAKVVFLADRDISVIALLGDAQHPTRWLARLEDT